MEKKGVFLLILFLTVFIGFIVGVIIDNIKLGFFAGMGIGVAFATALSSMSNRRR